MALFSRFHIGICALWLLTIGAGGLATYRYQATPGRIGRACARWPADAFIPLDPKKMTLIMFAHPKCPCTRASVEELNRILARTEGTVVAHVVFMKPEEVAADW